MYITTICSFLWLILGCAPEQVEVNEAKQPMAQHDKSNWGNRVSLYGAQVPGTSYRDRKRVLDVQNDSNEPLTVAWQCSSAEVDNPSDEGELLMPKVRIEFSTASGRGVYTFDACPGGRISIPARSLTVDFIWEDTVWIAYAGGGYSPVNIWQSRTVLAPGASWPNVTFNAQFDLDASVHEGSVDTTATYTAAVPVYDAAGNATSECYTNVPVGARNYSVYSWGVLAPEVKEANLLYSGGIGLSVVADHAAVDNQLLAQYGGERAVLGSVVDVVSPGTWTYIRWTF